MSGSWRKKDYLRRMGFLVKGVVSATPDMHTEVIQVADWELAAIKRMQDKLRLA